MQKSELDERRSADFGELDRAANMKCDHSPSPAGLISGVGDYIAGVHVGKGVVRRVDPTRMLASYPAQTAYTYEVPRLRIGMTGVMGVGKDFVADKMGCVKFGFADPMYRIAEEVLGTSDKSVPGVRKFLQDIGQWGRGEVSPEVPWSVERALFVERMQRRGSPRYGTDPDYWVKQCLDLVNQSAEPRIAVPNVRFVNEYTALVRAGFSLVHVTCLPDTLAARREALGYKDRTVFNNVSERLAQEYDRRFFADEPLPAGMTILWNDDPGLRPSLTNNTYFPGA